MGLATDSVAWAQGLSWICTEAQCVVGGRRWAKDAVRREVRGKSEVCCQATEACCQASVCQATETCFQVSGLVPGPGAGAGGWITVADLSHLKAYHSPIAFRNPKYIALASKLRVYSTVAADALDKHRACVQPRAPELLSA